MKKRRLLILFCLTYTFACAQLPAFEWAKSVGGPELEQGNSVVADAAGNVYVTGRFGGTADFDPGSGTFNLTSPDYVSLFILKLDPSGGFVWAKSIADAIGYSIAVDASGNVYTTGSFEGIVDFDPGAGTYNLGWGANAVFVLKLDASGNFVWATELGPSLAAIGRSIAIDNSGDVYTTGRYSGTVDFDPGADTFELTAVGGRDVYVSKQNTNGDFQWAKSIGGFMEEDSYGLVLDPAGNIAITGRFAETADFDPGITTFNLTASGSGGHGDAFITKLDASGNFLWAKSVGGPAYYGDSGFGIAADNGGNIYVTGAFLDTADFDPGLGVVSLFSGGDLGMFVLKLDPSGNFIWAKSMEGTGFSRGFAIALDELGGVYTTGSFTETSDFDPGPGTFYLSADAGGLEDVFISKLDAAGNFLWAGNAGPGNGLGIAVDGSNNIYTTGLFNGTVDFDFGPDVFNLTSLSWDVFVQKLNPPPVSGYIAGNTRSRDIFIYPNPSTGVFNVHFADGSREARLSIYDLLSKSVYEASYDLPCQIDLRHLRKGTYFIKAETKEEIFTQRIFIQ